jgi:hypothetical protein
MVRLSGSLDLTNALQSNFSIRHHELHYALRISCTLKYFVIGSMIATRSIFVPIIVYLEFLSAPIDRHSSRQDLSILADPI